MQIRCLTGDLPGYSFLNQVDIRLGKRVFLSPGVQFTSHADYYPIATYTLNYVVTGLNVFTNINLALLNRPKHRITLGAGPVLRFQSSSYSFNNIITKVDKLRDNESYWFVVNCVISN